MGSLRSSHTDSAISWTAQASLAQYGLVGGRGAGEVTNLVGLLHFRCVSPTLILPLEVSTLILRKVSLCNAGPTASCIKRLL